METLISNIDAFLYDYDYYNYQDCCNDHEESKREIERILINDKKGMIESLKGFLQDSSKAERKRIKLLVREIKRV